MNNFTFYAPTMFAFGQGGASRVGALVRQFGGSKVLLVAGGGSVKKDGAYDAVAASLKEAGLPWCALWGVQANPRSGKVNEGIDLARTEGGDFLLASGGGSGIDTAAGTYVISENDSEVGWSGVGQYEDLANPCALMTMMGAIAGRGSAQEPYLLGKVTSMTGTAARRTGTSGLTCSRNTSP